MDGMIHVYTTTGDKSSKYYAVRNFNGKEIVGIFEIDDGEVLGRGSGGDILSYNVLRAIAIGLEQSGEFKGTVWFPDAISKTDFETYKAFGFKQYTANINTYGG